MKVPIVVGRVSASPAREWMKLFTLAQKFLTFHGEGLDYSPLFLRRYFERSYESNFGF